MRINGREVDRLRRENAALHQAMDEAMAALRVAQRTLQAYADADVRLETPSGETVTRRLGDCLTTTLTVPVERRN